MILLVLAMILGHAASADTPVSGDWPKGSLALLAARATSLQQHPVRASADGSGGLWVAAHGELVRWTSAGTAEHQIAADTGWMIDGRVGTVSASDGTTWFGTPTGIGRLGPGVPTWFGPRSGLPDTRITMLAVSASDGGSPIAGTWRGLARSGPDGFTPTSDLAAVGLDTPVSALAVRGTRIATATPGRVPACGADLHPESGPRFATALQYSASGSLWAGGDALWVCENDHWRHVAEVPGGVVTLAAGPAERIWLGSGHGLRLLVGDELRAIGGPEASVVALLPQGDEVVVGTWGDGLWRCSQVGCQRLAGIRSMAQVHGVAGDAAGNTWVTADGALFRCSSACEAFEHAEVQAAGGLGPLSVDGEILWVGSPGGGGLLRIATDTDVRRYAPDRKLPDADILDLLPRNGDLWLATEAGLVRYADGQFLPEPEIEPPVYSLATDRENRLWIGNRAGLTRFEAAGPGSVALKPVQLSSGGAVRAIAVDGKGHIWAGGPDGLIEYNSAFAATHHTAQLPDASVRDIAIDAQGSIWVGTSGGLAQWRGNAWHHYGRAEGLPSNVVWSVHCDSRGGVWVGTFGGGAARYDGTTFHHLSTSHGLPSNVVRQILADDRGDIWLLTDAGLASVSIESLPDVRSSGLAAWLIPGSLAVLLAVLLVTWRRHQ